VAYRPNPGRLPPECVVQDEAGEIISFRSVHVRLHNGIDTKARGNPPWPSAGGRPSSTNWQISRPPHPFQIQEWELA
jgi:hypothetical protein